VHFFDIVADDIIYEVRYELGWPCVFRRRTNLMDQSKAYVGGIQLQSAEKLIVNKADNAHVVVVGYAIHGTNLATGAKYENRFCSIIELGNKKITRWRDYMDWHAALVVDDDAPGGQRNFDHPQAERKSQVQADRVANDLGRKPVTAIMGIPNLTYTAGVA
jgi:uncharacterized protein